MYIHAARKGVPRMSVTQIWYHLRTIQFSELHQPVISIMRTRHLTGEKALWILVKIPLMNILLMSTCLTVFDEQLDILNYHCISILNATKKVAVSYSELLCKINFVNICTCYCIAVIFLHCTSTICLPNYLPIYLSVIYPSIIQTSWCAIISSFHPGPISVAVSYRSSCPPIVTAIS